ncbi:anthocyanidin 3-O-glucosyltransferase 5-like [Andrographis paniculata]|uniref:anthocyanidin 3-O-glucosyltransferase 5-like n=1 Tax=Andrographis paniculata TaxID=175694 RepID=UPI0021E8346E|nr:anthocyanidin 3-O-glucosyltransferase 5-like [Andrographis paniculata]
MGTDSDTVVSSSYDDLHHSLNVAVLSSPGMGHFIPALLLANRLAAHHRVRVTLFLVATSAAAGRPNLPPHDPLVRILTLPPVDISHLVNPSTQVFTKLCLMVRQALPAVRAAVAAMDPRPDALIATHFAYQALEIAAEFGLPKYVYFPSSAWFTALTAYLPVLDREIAGEYVDQAAALRIPGCKPLRTGDVVQPMMNRKEEQHEDYVRMGKNIPLFDGILCNSWQDLEPETFRAFKENEALKSVVKIPVYPIGPLSLCSHVEPGGSGSELMTWLDRQPSESVVYVSFGSGGVLSADQITELAWGLELSRQRFLWVVRPPADNGGHVDGAFFNMGKAAAGGLELDYLPDGFSARTRDRGVVVPEWAPQVEILKHPGVGGFLSHCGWNSCLESVMSGAPMVAWPLYAEQRMNAAFMAEEAGVAVRVTAEGVVGRWEIEEKVRAVMEGKTMREKAKQLQKSAADGLRRGGASEAAMRSVLARIVGQKM